MDALLLLRSFASATPKKDVVLDASGDNLVFGDVVFPRKLKTPFRSKQSSTLLELDSVWFFLYNYERLGAGRYFKASKEAHVSNIPFADRKPLMAYMTSQVETCEQVDTSLAVQDDEKLTEVEEDDDVVMEDTSSSPHKRRRFNKADQALDASAWTAKDICANERAVYTRNTVMHGRFDFKGVLETYDAAQMNLKSSKGKGKKKGKVALPPAVKVFKPKNAQDVIPIIIVPKSVSAMITMYNAGAFLERGVFIESEAERKNNPTKPSSIQIQRVSSKDAKRNVKFQIVDDVKTITQWDRVVAVFVTGAKWQFKDFPWDTPAKIFAKVIGFHLHFKDEKPSASIQSWDCHTLKISKTTRYQDRGVVLDFWRVLIDWIKAQPAKQLLEF